MNAGDCKGLGPAGRALAVLVFDAKVSAWLAENDPKALEQAKKALESEVLANPKKWVVTATLTPTNYNRPQSYIVEAATDRDAREIVKHQLRDLKTFEFQGRQVPSEKYDYSVAPYEPPPAGKVVG